MRLPPPTRAVALLLAAAALSGCQSITLNNTAQLRFIDASPDAGSLDAYQNNTGFAYNLGFGTVTSYVPMQPGSYALSADKSGTRQTLAAATVGLAPGHQYTAIVGNIAANMQLALYPDQTQPAPAGEIAVRILHQATRAGGVDVYLVPKSGRLTGTSPTAVNLNFGANSGYLMMPAGNYAIDVVPTGTTLVSSTTTLLSGAQIEYDAGSVRTIVLIDQESLTVQHPALTPGVQAIVATDVEASN